MKIYMVGQPNVGKSSLFSRMTGMGVISSNYPGTTVDIDECVVEANGVKMECVDLPGTYSLLANSPDEKILIESIMRKDADAIVVVIDSTNPEPGLVFLMEILELRNPTIVALNKYDLISDRCWMDVDHLSETFGIPFIRVSSKTGNGVDALLNAVSEGCARISDFTPDYDDIALDWIDHHDDPIVHTPDDRSAIRHLRKGRYDTASRIVKECYVFENRHDELRGRISHIMMRPLTGVPILAVVLASMFMLLSILGGLLSDGICWLYEAIVGTTLSDLGQWLFGEIGASILEGIDTSIIAVLGLVIPYILVFYLMLGILEDSGYLPRAVALVDRCMRTVGLHGNGLIPLIIGFGCNVPAIMSARTIRSRRERTILITLICLSIPCSSQLAIITGVTGTYAGIGWSAAIFGILLIIGLAGGIIMDHSLPKESTYLSMELPLLQIPSLRNVSMKMWMRSKDFFRLAIPFLIVGATLIEILIHFGALDALVEPMSWLTVDMLGLPAVTIIAFIAGIIRREMAYGVLLVLAGSTPFDQFMTSDQFIVFGIVMALFMPCLASMVSMKQELGKRDMLVIVGSCILISVLVGTLFNHMVL